MKINEISEQSLQSATTKMEAALAEMRALGRTAAEALIPVVRQMLDDPRVVALYWRQYIPEWNDGDPCLFTLGRRALILRPGLSFCCWCGLGDGSRFDRCSSKPEWGCSDRIIIDDDTGIDIPRGAQCSPSDLGFGAADDVFGAIEPGLQAVFGDNAEIVAHLKDGEVEFDVWERESDD